MNHQTDMTLITIEGIRKEIKRISSYKGSRQVYGHFMDAVADPESAPHLMLIRQYNSKTGVTTYTMKDTRTGENIK